MSTFLGTGKTMIRDALMTSLKPFGVTFFVVKCSDVCNMYYGNTEKFIAALFARARACSPSVISFDEIDSMFG